MSSLAHRRRAKQLTNWFNYLQRDAGIVDPVADFFGDLSYRVGKLGRVLSRHHLQLSTTWMPDEHMIIRINEWKHAILEVNIRTHGDAQVIIDRKDREHLATSHSLPHGKSEAMAMVMKHITDGIPERTFLAIFEKVVLEDLSTDAAADEQRAGSITDVGPLLKKRPTTEGVRSYRSPR